MHIKLQLSISSSPSQLATSTGFSVSVSLTPLIPHTRGIMQCLFFSDWLISPQDFGASSGRFQKPNMSIEQRLHTMYPALLQVDPLLKGQRSMVRTSIKGALRICSADSPRTGLKLPLWLSGAPLQQRSALPTVSPTVGAMRHCRVCLSSKCPSVLLCHCAISSDL